MFPLCASPPEIFNYAQKTLHQFTLFVQVLPLTRSASRLSFESILHMHLILCSFIYESKLSTFILKVSSAHSLIVCNINDSTVKQPLLLLFLRKEVIQPHLPIRLPCYDFTPVIDPAFGSSLLTVGSLTSGITNSHGVTGGVYKTRERIHRDILIRDY